MKHIEYLENLIGALANQGGGGGGITPTGTINLTTNGDHDVTTKATAHVAVPPYGEGSVNIVQNGTHNVSGKAQAVVAVPEPSGDLNITENGTYDVAAKARAIVNVQGGGGGGSANDWAYAFISGGYEGVLTDSTDPTVPRITKTLTGTMEYEAGLTGIDLQHCTSIGASSFVGCESLASVNLPVCTEILGSAFNNCGYISTFSAPACKEIKGAAMGTMWKTASLDLRSVENIGSDALRGKQPNSGASQNVYLRLVELPALKTANGNFSEFPGLHAIRFGSSVTGLQGNFARYDTSLDTVIFGQNQAAVPTMGKYVFGSTPIRTGTGYVYVPDALEEDWKSASLWSVIASHIKPLSAIVNWTAGSYNKPDVVKHNGHYYRCNTDGTSTEPGVDTTNWQDLGAIY